MMKTKIVFVTIIALLSIFLPNIASAQVSEYPQITEKACDSCTPCPEGLECINFPGIGPRCAESSPCSYFKCPLNTECIFSGPPEMVTYCPNGTLGKGIANVICQCVGPECPATSGYEDTVSYDLLTKTVVHAINPDEQTVSHNISLWKTTDENRGILETPTTTTEYRGRIVVKQSKLFMDTPAGEKPINILPGYAISKAKGVAETPEIKKVELKLEAEKPVYSVKGIKQARLLFIIPVSMEIETKIDAETKDVISVNKPWWSFLCW
ncbi:MAG: hypothetical protein DRO76_04410 [Candidatus Altiarchaeales archaeon]|nr:MAG: hypothetical protein DRO76_04410 [Candidatus Altiarchaeales archaeon]